MISNVKNEKHFVRVEVRGAATDDVMNRVAKEALEEWHKEFKRTRVQKRDPPQLKNALIRWEASDAQEFVTCGEDGTVKLWDLTQGLGVGGKMAQSVSDVSDATWGACFKPGTGGGETAFHTTPFAWCTPFLKDFSRRHSSPALPFQRLTGKTFY